MDSCILNKGITNSQPSFAAKSYESPLPTKMESKEKERELLRKLDQMRKIKYEAEKKQPMLILSLDTKLEKKLKFIETVKYFYLKLFFYSNIFDYEYEEVKKITQHNRENFTTLENIEFAEIGMLEKKLANIFLFIQNNQLNNNAIFLSEKQKKEISSIKKHIETNNKEINDENFLKCITILNRINYIKNTKELQKLNQADIKVFNRDECPTINTEIIHN